MAIELAEEKRALAMLMRAIGKFVYADGKADISEVKMLIGLAEPFASADADIRLFVNLLVDIAEDGVVDADESIELAAAIHQQRGLDPGAGGEGPAGAVGPLRLHRGDPALRA